MAVISCGILECGPFSEKTALCRGENFLSPKVGGGSSVRISVWECSSSKKSNNGSVCSDNGDVGAKRRGRGDDVISLSHIDERCDMKWWLPLFGWSQPDQELWANDVINGSETKGKAIDKGSNDDKKGMEEVQPKRSKSLGGRLTPEKAKLLRKNLRDTSTFHDAMYHSAIASRLASPDNEGH